MEFDLFAGIEPGNVVQQNVDRIDQLLNFEIPDFIETAHLNEDLEDLEKHLKRIRRELNPMEYDYLTVLHQSLVEERKKLLEILTLLRGQFQQQALMSSERLRELLQSSMHLLNALEKVDLSTHVLLGGIFVPMWYDSVQVYSKCTPFSESNERPPLLSIQALTTPAESELFVLTRLSPSMRSYSWEQANRNAFAEYHLFASFYERMYMNTMREADSCLNIMRNCPKQYIDECEEMEDYQVVAIEENKRHMSSIEVNRMLRDPETLRHRDTWFLVTQFLLDVENRISELYDFRYQMLQLNNIRKQDMIATKQGFIPRDNERFAGIPVEQINECRFDQIPTEYFRYREVHRMPQAWKLVGPQGEVGEEMEDVADVMRSMRDAVAVTQIRKQVSDRDFRAVYENISGIGPLIPPFLDDYTTEDFLD